MYENKVEHYRRQLEWIQEDTIPYQEILNFPSIEAWSEVTRREVQGFRRFGEADQSEDVVEINRRLESQKITSTSTTRRSARRSSSSTISPDSTTSSDRAQDLIDNEQLKVSLQSPRHHA